MSINIDRLPRDCSQNTAPAHNTQNSDFEGKYLAGKFGNDKNANQNESRNPLPHKGSGNTMPPPPQDHKNASEQDSPADRPPLPPQNGEEGQWPAFTQNNAANEGGFGAPPPSFGPHGPERQNGSERPSEQQDKNGSR